jgi:hypothetical protein
MRITGVFAVVAGTLVPGCVSIEHKPLASSGLEALRGREATIGVRDKPDFSAFTPGKAAFGLIGAAAMIEAGNRIVRANNVEDPARVMARTLVAELGERHGVTLAPETVRIGSDDVPAIAKSYPKADLLLDVRTINWNYAYYPTAWGRYRVMYSARVRLIDIKRATVLAEGACSRVPDDAAKAPTEEELLANNAERLKAEIFASAHACLQQVRNAAFALAGPAPAFAGVTQTASEPAPVSSAALAPNPAVAAMPLGTGGLPREGDTWIYRLSDTARSDRARQRRYEVKVAAASAGEVVERYTVEDGPSGEWKHSSGAYLVRLGPSLFSPYLGAFRDLSAQPALGEVESDDPTCAGRAICDIKATVVGREVVQVPAGRFETIKVTIDHDWRNWRGITGRGSGGGSRQMDVWYAPAVKRAVKFSSRSTGMREAQPSRDFDLELESYQLK